MDVVLKKMGNSAALVMPPHALKELGIGVGQHMSLHTTADGRFVLTPKRRYVLADLIAQCSSRRSTHAASGGMSRVACPPR